MYATIQRERLRSGMVVRTNGDKRITRIRDNGGTAVTDRHEVIFLTKTVSVKINNNHVIVYPKG